MENNSNKNISEKSNIETKKTFSRKLWIFVSIVLILGGFSASIFGIAKYSAQDNAFVSSYETQDKYEMEVSIDWSINSNYDIYSYSEVVNSRLEFYDLSESLVSIVNDSTLYVEIPITSINTNDGERFDSINERDLFEEVLLFNNVLTKNSYIEFRDVNNDLLFVYEDGQVKFVEPNISEEGTEPTSLNSNDAETFDFDLVPKYDVNLFKDARVAYTNGVPYVEVLPSTNDIKIQMMDMAEYMPTLADSETAGANLVYMWFSFDELDYFLDKLDPEGYNGDPLEYIFMDPFGEPMDEPIELAEPYFLGSWDIQIPFSIHNPWIPINSDFTEQEAQYLVEAIKFSNDSSDVNINYTNINFSDTSTSTLNWLHYVILLLLGITALFMVWWFGLLGLIASLELSIVAVAMLGIISAMGIPFSSLIISSVAITLFVTLLLSVISIKLYKRNISVSKTTYKKLLFNYKDFSRRTSSFLIVFLIILTFGAVVTPNFVQAFIYLTLFGIMISIVATYLIMFLGLYWMDKLFNFTLDKNEEWNYIEGMKLKKIKPKYKNSIVNKFSTNKTSKTLVFGSIMLIIISLSIFGILSLTTGSGINSFSSYENYYKYDVVYIQRWNEDNSQDLPNDWTPTFDDPFAQNDMINSVSGDKKDIIDVFSNYDVKTENAEIIRNENYYLWYNIDPEFGSDSFFDYSFSYGLTIFSYDKINTSYINAINSELITIGKGYELTESWSLINANEPTSISSYSTPFYSEQMFISILLAFAFALLFIWIFYKWNNLFVTMFSVLLETLLIFGFMIIFYNPFGTSFFLGMLAFIAISMVTKTIIMSKVKYKSTLVKKVNEKFLYNEYKDVASKSVIWTIGSLVFMIFIFTMPMIIGNSNAITGLLFMIYGLIVLPIWNTFVLPPILSKFHIFRLKRKEQIQIDDEMFSRLEGNIDEEYIKGINK